MPRRKQLISIRKPRMSLTKKGLRVTAPSARIGGKAGLNVSRSGVSYSVRSKAGSFNSTRGCSRTMMLVVVMMGVVLLAGNRLSEKKLPKGEV